MSKNLFGKGRMINYSSIVLLSLLSKDSEAPTVGTVMHCTHHDCDVEVVDWNGAHPQALVKWTDDNGMHRQSIPKVYLKSKL